MSKKIYTILIINAILVILLGLATLNIKNETSADVAKEKNQSSDDGIDFVEVKKELPEFALQLLVGGDELELDKNTLSGKYSLVNFFASWCSTCLQEHQMLFRIRDDLHLATYGIAFRDIDARTKDFLAKNGNPFDLVGKDSGGLFFKIAGVKAVPESWIVNPKGILIARLRGNLQEFSVQQIKSIIEHDKNLTH